MEQPRSAGTRRADETWNMNSNGVRKESMNIARVFITQTSMTPRDELRVEIELEEANRIAT